MTKLQKKKKINCVLCNYLWLQSLTPIPEEKQKILLAVNILVFTEKSVRIIDYLFNIMITGKVFQCSYTLFETVEHSLKNKGIVTSSKKWDF